MSFTTGATSPGSASSSYFTNPTNALVSDNVYAVDTAGDFTRKLYVSNFGFALPSNAINIMLSLSVEAKSASNSNVYIGATIDGVNYNADLFAAGGTTTSDAYVTYGPYATTLTYTQINSSAFGILSAGYTGISISIDHARITATYDTFTNKTQTSTSVGSQTFTKSTTTQPFVLANNNQAYVLNINTGAWTFIDNHPFTSMIYRPLFKTVLGARREDGNICTINSGSLFDLTEITWSYQTGFYNFGELDEIKDMPANASESLKRVRALFSEVKSTGNITLTVYTENDSTGQTFTITPTTTDNTVYNMVRTTLSRDIRGKYVSFKFSGTVDAWIGETGLKIAPRGIR